MLTLIRPQGSVSPVLVRLSQGEYTLLYGRQPLEELMDLINLPHIRDKHLLGLDPF